MNKYKLALWLKKLAQNYVNQGVKLRQKPNFITFLNS